MIGWLDYSEDERQRMREIIDLFRDEDSVDELGIGAIRDSLAELLFPGLNTIQTRARYFLLIPWVYRKLEVERVKSGRAAAKARALQTDLVKAMERGGVSGSEGVFGWSARENLRRLPAEVYWTGLRTFGIRFFEGSIEEYHRSLDSYHRRASEFNKGEGDEVSDTFLPNWNSHLPDAPPDLFHTTDIEMTEEEAAFLADQVRLNCRRTLLAWFIDNPVSDVRSIPTPWEHPASSSLSGDIARWLHHARLFSEVMHGAAIAYNLLLAELAARRGLDTGDFEARYRKAIQRWADDMRSMLGEVRAWDKDDFWNSVRSVNPRLSLSDQSFASHWIQTTRADPSRIAALPDDIRHLIRERELRKKRGKARLHHPRALEMWSGSSGMGRLLYRWPTAQAFIDDIHRGLGLA